MLVQTKNPFLARDTEKTNLLHKISAGVRVPLFKVLLIADSGMGKSPALVLHRGLYFLNVTFFPYI
jgi:hypothetical protein